MRRLHKPFCQIDPIPQPRVNHFLACCGSPHTIIDFQIDLSPLNCKIYDVKYCTLNNSKEQQGRKWLPKTGRGGK